MVAVTVVCALVAGGVLLWQEFRPSADGVAEKVQVSMQESLDADQRYASYNMHVIRVSVIRKSGNEFDGIATIRMPSGSEHQVPIDVTTDGEQVMWQTQPGAFVFLLQEPAPGMAS